MTALSAAKSLAFQEEGIGFYYAPMVDNVKIYKGGLVMAVAASGLARPASDTASTVVIGVAEETVDNTQAGHSAGSGVPTPAVFGVGNWVKIRFGIIIPVVLASGAITQLWQKVFVVDDQTVQHGATSNSIPAGVLVEYDSSTSGKIYVPGPDLSFIA